MVGFLIYMLFFCMGVFVGYLIKTWLYSRHSYDGKIVVTQDRHKTLYSLELEDYPDMIQFKKEVILKVDASDESLNRE